MPESAFTKTHLEWLNNSNKSYQSPLAVIAHVDLDAFYAQCQQVRLGLSKKDPIVCRQWNGLIAISYAARRCGVKRHETAMSAKEKCKDVIFAHVATFKKGETEWKYHDNPRVETHKVSLDPFRRESRKIFAIFKEYCEILEKASIDETYFDLGAVVYRKIMEIFPELKALNAGDPLPAPPKLKDLPKEYEWTGTVIGFADDELLGESVGTELYDFDKKEEENDETTPKPPKLTSTDPGLEINDWDDVCLLIASVYIRDIRKAVLEKLDYTCSAGIARNKILAKLASGRYKPARQTVVRSSEIAKFLDNFELTDVGGLGGKLGDEIKSRLEIPESGSIKYLRDMSKDEMLKKLSPSLAKRLKNIINGEEISLVNTRTDIKSMMATKNFTANPVSNLQDAQDWLKVFAAELYGRMMELSESKERISFYPKTLTVSFKGRNFVSHNKQVPFPTQIVPDKLRETLYNIGYSTLEQIQAESNSVFPCALLALGVSNFHDNMSALKSNKTLFSFFAQAPKPRQESKENVSSPIPSETEETPPLPSAETGNSLSSPAHDARSEEEAEEQEEESDLFVTELPEGSSRVTLQCEKCRQQIPLEDVHEHRDWHFAQALQKSQRKLSPPVVTARTEPLPKKTLKLTKAPPKTVKRISGMPGIGTKKKQKIDKNQTFLKF